MVNEFTDEDDESLAVYIATDYLREFDRHREDIYKRLVENPDQWPWSVRHTWKKWMTRYLTFRERFDHRIHAIQEMNRVDHTPQSHSPNSRCRMKFTEKEDNKLVRFLAKMAPIKLGRSGNAIYKNVLVARPHKYPWAKTHTWQSWRNRYVKRHDHFDALIFEWQMRHGVDPGVSQRTVGDSEASTDSESQTDNQLQVFNESQHSAKHGTKRRRLENEKPIVPDGPLPKRRKNLPVLSDDEFKEPIETAPQNGSILPVVVENGINHGEDQTDVDQLVATLSRQDVGACEVGEDNKYNKKSSHQFDHSDGRDGLHKSDKSLPALPQKSDSFEDPHIRVPTNTPTQQRFKEQLPAPSKKNHPSGDVSTPNIIPVEFRISINESTGLPNKPMKSPPSSAPCVTTGVSGRTELCHAHIPDYFDTSGDASEVSKIISQHPTSQPVTAGRSHHPTPPSTNVQSEWSVKSPSIDSDLSTTAGDKEKSSHAPSERPLYDVASPRLSPVTPATTYQRAEPTLVYPQTPLFTSYTSDSVLESPPFSRRTADLQEPVVDSPLYSLGRATRGEIPIQDDDRDESATDGPFASPISSSPPPRIEVIHGLPKRPPGMSFRGNNLIRERRVISRTINQSGLERDAISRKGNDQEKARSHRPKGQEARSGKCRLNQPQFLDALGNNLSTEVSSSQATVDQPFNRSALSKQVDSGQQDPITIGSMPTPAKNARHLSRVSKAEDSPGDITSQSQGFEKDLTVARTEVKDVFRTLTPVAPGKTHDPYVLNATHLSSSASPTIHPLDSPVFRHKVPRDQARRRTFAGFKSRSSLPSIDLVKKLGERASSRTSTQFRTRRTSLGNTSNSDSTAVTPLATSERRITRYCPPRPSVIPVLTGPESSYTASALSHQWSPSTYNLVIRAGLGAVFKRMEENHGFSASVVRRAWLQQKMDLDATDRMLLRMRVAAENASHGDDYTEQQQGLTSNMALQETRNRVSYLDYTTPDPDTFSDDYTPPARSRAEQHRRLSEAGHRGEAQWREIDLVGSHRLSKTFARKNILPQAVWGAEDDQALRSGERAKLEALVEKFSDDTVRCRFLLIMRENHVK